MTDPQQYAAEQIGQLASDVHGQTASQEDIAASAQASSGLGVTEVDVNALAAQIAAMQAQIDAMNAAAAPKSALAGTVATLRHFLGIHGDPAAVELGNDLAEAAGNAEKSGSVEYAAKIGAKLNKHLTRNPPYPGENYAYRHALDFSGPHLEDALATVQPPAAPAAALPSAGGQPVKVIAGNVTG